jgi:hypothetical protein
MDGVTVVIYHARAGIECHVPLSLGLNLQFSFAKFLARILGHSHSVSSWILVLPISG